MTQTEEAAKKGGSGGLSQADKIKIIQARAGLIGLLTDAKASLATWDDAAKASFKTSFGTDSAAAHDLISGRVDRELALVNSMTLSNFKIDASAGSGTFAYVYPGDSTHTVHLGPSFWSAPLSGVDSSAGTLRHEISHFRDIGGTKDGFPNPTYGLPASSGLAGSSPGNALHHADTFEYYLERAP